MEKIIQLESLPLKNPNAKTKIFDWDKIIYQKIPIKFKYDTIEGEIIVLERVKKTLKIFIEEYTPKDGTWIVTHNLVRCRLAEVLGKFTKEFKAKSGDIITTKFGDVKIVEQIYLTRTNQDGSSFRIKGYKIHCDKHNIDYNLDETSLLITGQGCPLCSSSRNYCVKGINDINTTDPELAKYIVDENDRYTHTRSSDKNVLMQCPNCGFKKLYPIKALTHHGFTCACNDNITYPNRFMANILLQSGLKFIQEVSNKTLSWIPDLIKYDFYIDDSAVGVLIEMDGHQHFHTIKSHINKDIEYVTARDNYKTRLAFENNVPLVRIDCNYKRVEFRHNHIKTNILNSILNDIIDFDKINWIDVERLSLPSKVKEVCNDYMKNHNSPEDMVEQQNLSATVIRKYLILGKFVGWSDYNGFDK